MRSYYAIFLVGEDPTIMELLVDSGVILALHRYSTIYIHSTGHLRNNVFEHRLHLTRSTMSRLGRILCINVSTGQRDDLRVPGVRSGRILRLGLHSPKGRHSQQHPVTSRLHLHCLVRTTPSIRTTALSLGRRSPCLGWQGTKPQTTVHVGGSASTHPLQRLQYTAPSGVGRAIDPRRRWSIAVCRS